MSVVHLAILTCLYGSVVPHGGMSRVQADGWYLLHDLQQVVQSWRMCPLLRNDLLSETMGVRGTHLQ